MIQYTCLPRRKVLAVPDREDGLAQGEPRGVYQLLGQLRIGDGEHGSIVFRHDHGEGSPVAQTDLLAERPVVWRRTSIVSSTGHDKVGVPAAGKITGAKDGLKNSRETPAVSGGDKNPGFCGGQLQCNTIPDKVKGVQQLIFQLICQHFSYMIGRTFMILPVYHYNLYIFPLLFSSTQKYNISSYMYLL